jgi:hypothetical protein
MIKNLIFLIMLACLFGCDKTPANKIINPAISNAAGAWDTNADWVLYGDEIRTGGTIMMFNTLDNQVLDLSCTDNPHSGIKCIKYSWNGKDVYKYAAPAGLEHDFCGFSLIASNDVNRYNLDSKNISGGAYTKISFWARGSLNAFVYLRLESDKGNSLTPTPGTIGTDAWMSNAITSNWNQYQFNITGTTMTNLKDFVKIILKYDEGTSSNTATGNGGTVFIDDIKLTH